MKKDLLIFQQYLIVGGVEKVTLNLLQNIDRNKFNIKLVLVEKCGELLEQVPKEIEVIGLLDKNHSRGKNKFLKFIGYLKELLIIKKNLKKIIKKDDILLNMNIRNIRVNLNFLPYKNIKIGWIHGNIYNDLGTLTERINYKLFSQYNIIFNLSLAGKKDFDKKFPMLAEKTQILCNSFDIDKIVEKSKETLEEENFILTVGRLSYEKGFDILIDAMRLLKDEGFDEKLYIVGEGPERKNLEEQIQKLNLENNVFLKGMQINPFNWMKKSKIFVLSSRGEGLPTVLIEALACEAAIVSADCKCGPNEILKSGEYGILVPAGNCEQLKEGIKKLLLNEKLRRSLKEKGLNRAYDFSNKKILRNLENIIEKIKRK